ncbi:MAG: DUF5615 family PIN-like protein [Acidobacteriaceae bacterium]|nr:DUF5615 family PIN-like protein [Acidobacteriaceae bacterium]MBV9294644.1 DUF5615 family PIN-like protein [Acidobacteriaceae bacterium]MBV9766903.1 DUF5615 family PIN-like protein [Acidobacteriaceae bacterium]
MSRLRLYLDEDAMRRSLVFGLRARTVDVLTALEADMINREDQAHLVTASELGRAVYTYNAGDFVSLHRKWVAEEQSHSGIIIGAQQRYRPGEELRRLMRLISSVTAEHMRNRVEFLSSWS